MTTCSIIVGHDVFKRINCCSHSLFINLFPAPGKTRPSQKGWKLIFRCFSISFRKGPEASQKTVTSSTDPSLGPWIPNTLSHKETLFPRTLAFQANHSFQVDFRNLNKDLQIRYTSTVRISILIWIVDISTSRQKKIRSLLESISLHAAHGKYMRSAVCGFFPPHPTRRWPDMKAAVVFSSRLTGAKTKDFLNKLMSLPGTWDGYDSRMVMPFFKVMYDSIGVYIETVENM